ncbi:ATP-binding protein [Adlercreutzia equolifaciens]|uniref:sensor histidine kinase n=1 Tax=Adlercreutzia equolifaciens TaxID=446660 RepID=UPI0023B1CD5C|nr:ATP-binding protein [Adlercreutzia equolifaciens]MDE8701535.1 ATP-binding protein [Adlercreutzia equolifaciens]
MAPLKEAMSLSGRIFRSVLAFALVGIVLFSVVITGIFYISLEHDASAKLLAQAHRAAAVLDEEPVDARPAVLAEQFDGAVRYTLIDANGAVLFDSAAPADGASWENHADRPEVRAALESGEGATSRHSTTLNADTLYAAAPLSNGSVVRLAETRASLIAFFATDLMMPVALALLAAVVLVLVLSRLLTRHLMRPLDNLDVSSPLDNAAYAEMQPLLERIDSQQRTLRAQNEELARAESLRRDFSANVSHEMKTPLQVISGYAELMANNMVPAEEVPRFAGLIYEESQAMRALINDVLVLSRLDESSGDIAQTGPVNLAAVADHVVHRLAAPAHEAGVVVSLETVPVWVEGSELLLEQMIYNLVENAVRYNHEGGAVQVQVTEEMAEGAALMGEEGTAQGRSSARGPEAGAALGDGDAAVSATAAAHPPREAVVRVSDTGAGIPLEAQEKIFERFYRLDKSRSKETGGTGLGLAIVKHAALYHGGEVSLESEEGQGTTFTVRLPLAPEEPLSS